MATSFVRFIVCEHKLCAYLRSPAAIVLGITILGLGLRLHRLPQQSMFWDEYSVYALTFNSWASTATALALWGAGHVPGYYGAIVILQHLIEISPVALRLMAVLASSVCIPLLYLLSRHVYDRPTAYGAALLIAISPMHVWWGQAIQCYAYTTPLAMLSTLMFLHIERGRGGSLWVAYVVVNMAMVFTHYFTGLVIAAHGLYLIVRAPCAIYSQCVWLLTQLLAIAPSAYWLYLYRPFLTDYGDYTYPTPEQTAAAFFGRDVVRFNYEFELWGTWSFLPEAVRDTFFALEPLANMVLIILGGFLVCVAAVFRSERRNQGTLLLLFVAIGPPVAILLLTYLLQPVFAYRFILYSSFAFYALLGAGIQTLPLRPVRWIVGSVLLVLYAFQASLILPTYSRTPWLEATRLMVDHDAGGTAFAYVRGVMPMYGAEMLQANCLDGDIDATNVYSRFDVLERLLSAAKERSPGSIVWLVLESRINSPNVQQEEEMIKHFLDQIDSPYHGPHTFLGMSRLDVYEIIVQRPAIVPDLSVYAEAIDSVAFLDLPLESTTVRRDLARILLFPLEPNATAAFYLLPHVAFDLGAEEVGCAMVKHAVKTAPSYPPNHLNGVLSAMRRGEKDEAFNYLVNLETFGSINLRSLTTVLRLTLEQTDLQRRDALLDLFRHWGVFYRVLSSSIAMYEHQLSGSPDR